MESKYIKLKEYLKNYTVTISYNDIEKIIIEKLPQLAYVHRAWWSNTGHEHAKTWTEAGWKVEEVEIGKSVTFRINK
ncbi:MAG: hypothetical protein FJW61_04575 [Actinobacteria bacterium]|nr:hypothetical protein [Actinomycetota bacterium]